MARRPDGSIVTPHGADQRYLRVHHFYWPDLDVDLAVDSIDHPDRLPLTTQFAETPGPD